MLPESLEGGVDLLFGNAIIITAFLPIFTFQRARRSSSSAES